MYNLRQEIADEFFSQSGYEKTDKRTELIIPRTYEDMPGIFLAVDGGMDIDDIDNYTNECKEYIKELRASIIKEFELEGSESDIYNTLTRLEKIYQDAENIVEFRHRCDVTDDINTLSSNVIDCLRRYIRIAKDLGYDISIDDIINAHKDNFRVNDIYYLKCAKTLFNGDIQTPGLINYFSKQGNYLLKHGSELDKINVKVGRLKYLNTIGIPYKFITIDDLEEPSNDEKWLEKIDLEYEFQKNMPFEPKFVDYFDYRLPDIKKNFRSGQFFPLDLANQLEEERIEICEHIVDNCKFFENKQPMPLNSEFNNFMINDYEDRDIMKPYGDLFILEDYVITEDDFIDALSHEINHIIGHDIPQKIDPVTNIFTSKTGLNFRQNVVDENNQIMFTYEGQFPVNLTPNDAMQKIEEYVNQRQCMEASEILKESGIDLGLDEDKIYKGDLYELSCVYDTYHFLLNDFYEKYYNEIKLQKVDNMYNIYFKHDLPFTKSQKITAYIKDKLNKMNNVEYAEEGVVDYYKVQKLAELVDHFDRYILPLIPNEEIVKGKDIDFSSLDPKLQKEINKLIAKKDKIMADMAKDDKRVMPPEMYNGIDMMKMCK